MTVPECYQYFLDWYLEDRVPQTYDEVIHLFHLMDELGIVDKPDSRLAQFLDYLQGVDNGFVPESDIEHMICADYEESRADDFILSVRNKFWDYKKCFPPEPTSGTVVGINSAGEIELL